VAATPSLPGLRSARTMEHRGLKRLAGRQWSAIYAEQRPEQTFAVGGYLKVFLSFLSTCYYPRSTAGRRMAKFTKPPTMPVAIAASFSVGVESGSHPKIASPEYAPGPVRVSAAATAAYRIASSGSRGEELLDEKRGFVRVLLREEVATLHRLSLRVRSPLPPNTERTSILCIESVERTSHGP
jgi:hypothetical protein